MPYYRSVAVRKSGGKGAARTGKKTPGKSGSSRTLPLALIFWLIFFIAVTGLFLANRDIIKRNFNILAQRLNLPIATAPETDSIDDNPEGSSGSKTPESGSGSSGSGTSAPAPKPAVQAPAAKPAEKPAVQPATTTPPATSTTPAAPAESKPAVTEKPPAPAEKPAAPSPAKPAETRERAVYFTQVDKDGAILRTRVTRKISVSDSPMLDSLNALLSGPTAEEQRRGLVSLIPGGARVLSAVVRGNTAYISFSEDFQYNTYGVEGYAAQLKQIVWTVTEFSNIKDVQILIEGRRVDYLGEGIWIGSPVNRDTL
jgi:spore germination protein GerM